jgi:endogenous inhibitor of DNA gyrase (YacG/DUF329 family)
VSGGPENDNMPPQAGACPICGKPTVVAYRPFCSRRCADVDLHRWFAGHYAVPAVENEDRPDDPDADEGRT